MATRRYPILTATRFDRRERALIDAVAASEGVTVTELLRRLILPQVGAMLRDSANDLDTQREAGDA